MAHIFVVDDDEQLLRMIGLMLERGGHSATLMNNPLEALERIKEDRPDLAILDVMMPGMSGHDLCRALRTQEPTRQMPVMILTARAQEYDRQTAMQGGADDYLSKPVTSQELLARVDRLLVQRHTTRSLAIDSTVVALTGFSGGVGRTTIAANLAAQLRATTQAEICLVDLTTSGGQLAMHLRLQPKSSWVNLLNQGDGTGWAAIEPHLISHPSGLHLLAAPTTPIPPTYFSADTAGELVDHLRRHMSFVILDLPAVLSEAARGALVAADLIFHVLSPDVVAVQTALRTERMLQALGITSERLGYVLNQGTAEPQLSRASVERGLNEAVRFQIGYDANQARALMQGNPLCLTPGQSALPVAMQKIATSIWQRATTDRG